MAKKRSNRATWIVALVIVLIAVAYFQLTQKPEHKDTPHYELEKTGAGAVADFTAAAHKIHAAVDAGLTKSGLVVRDMKEANREVPRKNMEGSIRWHARQLLVYVAADKSPESVQQAINSMVVDAGGVVLNTQPDTYQEQAVVRLDIGLRDTLANEPLTIITDRLYVAKEKATAAPGKPQAGGAIRGQLAIILDDFGYSREPIDSFVTIGRPLTFSVLPYHPYSQEAASRALSSGLQVMLHLPMEPLATAEQSEESTVTVAMSDAAIEDIVTKAISSIPGLMGVNNHQGSRATADKRVMRTVLGVIKSNNLFFLDSRTSSQSVAMDMARQAGVRTGENALFLDNSNEVSAVKKQLRTAGELAIRYGSAIVIGHARVSTATALREMIPELEASGVKLVFASQLVK